ncbi:MAG TPA: multiheme c-type cytochrome [Polyangia bacterium]|nr:multiheme c-type cytochrome [Polyangia bacterium]
MPSRKHPRRASLLGAALICACLFAASSQAAPGAGAKPSAERRVALFYTAEVHGTVEPCGCTSDPLGDVSRLAGVLADARRAGTSVALVDAGGLLYPEGSLSAKERPSADLRADFLAGVFDHLGLIGAGLGETDLSGGLAHLKPARLASNITGAGAALAAPTVHKVGDVAVGVLGVADPALAAPLKGKAEDATAAAQRDVAALRKAGAEIVVLLAPIERTQARKLARESGADVVVVGKRVGHGQPRLERVGRAFLVAPEDELQRIGRLDIVVRSPATPGAPLELTEAGGVEANRLRREEITRSLERLRGALANWGTAGAAGGSSDGDFVASKKREVKELEAEFSQLSAPWQPPATGNYVVNALVPLHRRLRRDPALVAKMKALDKAIAAVNLRQATPPPAAEPGRATYVGMDRCASCHKSAMTFWKHTVHAHAWKTLVDGGKQADYKCVSCHVTGFGQVGGSSLGFTKKLESVQCETCHGPGSLHVAGEGNEEPLAIKRDTPETVCLTCHTEQHSDTFVYDAYLRDIVGPGHGGKRRDALGAGKTGHELRSAALARAKSIH